MWEGVPRALVPLIATAVGGIIGHNLLSRYRVTFGLQRGVLGLD